MDSLVGWNDALALAVEKPEAGEQVTVAPVEGQGLDLSSIAALNAQFYQTGSDLWLVFEDGAIVVVEGYFEGASETAEGTPRSVVVDGETFTGQEFLTAFAIDDLPEEFAEGETGDAGPQQNGTSFDDPTLGDLGPGGQGIGLLGNADRFGTGDTGTGGGGDRQDTDPTLGATESGAVDEDGIVSDGQSVFTGSLGVDFGNNGDDTPDSADLQDTPTGFGDRSITFDSADVGSAIPLSSGGTPLTFALSNGGTVLTASANGVPVFEVRLFDDGAGSYRFTLLGPIDHPDATSEDDLGLTFSFTATDDDGDSVSGTFTVTVDDDVPEAGENDLVQLDDDALGGNPGGVGDVDPDTANTTGTLDHSFGADGGTIAWVPEGVTTSDGADGLRFTTDEDGSLLILQTQNGQEVVVATITLNRETGDYEVTQDNPLMHSDDPANRENDQDFVLTYRVTDGDGDTADGTIRLTINDDTPVIGSPDASQFDAGIRQVYESGDVDLPIPDSGTIESTIDVPEGGMILDLNVTINLTHTFMADLDITLIAPDGTRILLIADKGVNGNPNGPITLDDEAAQPFSDARAPFVGTWRPTEDALSGLDGLDQAGTWTLSIVDDAFGDVGTLRSWSLEIETPVNAIVDEDDLPLIGNSDDAPGDDSTATNPSLDTDGDPTTVAGDLGIAWGADDANSDVDGGASDGPGDRAVNFTDTSDAVANITVNGGAINAADLTSRGDAITYSLDNDGGTLIATADLGGPNERVVFTVVLSDDDSGSFVLSLQDVLDHPEAGTEDNLDLTFSFTATDSDGDSTTSDFTVSVDDDSPVIGTGDVQTFDSGTVDLRIPASGSSGTIESTIDIPEGGTIRDVNVTIDLTHTIIGDLDITLIAPDGTRILLIADEGGGSPDGPITFDDEAGLTFAAADAPFTGTWRPSRGELARFDGLDQAGTWTLSIHDDAILFTGTLRSWSLEIETDPKQSIDEDDLPAGTDDTKEALAVTGDLAIVWGADDADNDALGGATGDRTLTFDAELDGASAPFTADGEPIIYALSPDGTVLTASSDGTDIFTVELNDDALGSFTFTLLNSFDHPASNEDIAALHFDFVAKDSDGDTVSGSFTVDVTDDSPVAQDDAVSTDEDTSLIINVLDNDAPGADGVDPSTGVSIASGPSNGSVVVNADGTITYTPDENYSGDDSFTYTLTDGDGDTSTATVNITIDPVADAPDVSIEVALTPQPVTGDIQVNSFTDNEQAHSSIAALSDGGFVVTWTSRAQEGTSDGVFGQRYNASGVPAGNEFQINTTTGGLQNNSSVTGLPGGGFIVTWQSARGDGDSWGIYGQRYDASGSPVGGEFLVNTTTAEAQNDSSIAALEDGGFVITWQSFDQDGSSFGIYGQRFDSTGVKVDGEFQVNTFTPGIQNNVAVAGLEGGGFVVTWTSSTQIYGQLYDDRGFEVGGEFRINTETRFGQLESAVAALEGGGFVVTWTSSRQDGDGSGVFGQLYNASGAPEGAEFQVNTETSNRQTYSSVAALPDGGFVVTWSSLRQDGSGWGIYGQRFDSSGAPVGNEFRLNATVAGDQVSETFELDRATTVLADGTLVSTWSGEGEVFMRLFDVPVTREDETFNLNLTVAVTDPSETITEVTLAGLPDGFVISDGTNSATSDGTTPIAITGWALGDLTVTPEAGWSGDPTLLVSATSTDGTDTATTIETLTFQIVPSTFAPVVSAGDEFRINQHIDLVQVEQQVTQLADGRVLIVFETGDGTDGDNSGRGISGRIGRPQADGSMSFGDEFRINQHVAGDQIEAQVTLLADGRVLVVFETGDDADGDDSGQGVSGRIGRPQADGSMSFGDEFAINERITDNQLKPQVTLLADGRVLVIFETGDDADGDDSGQGISGLIGRPQPDGSMSFGDEFAINQHVDGDQQTPQATLLADGRVLVIFQTDDDTDGDDSGPGVSGRIGTVQPDGSMSFGNEFRINEHRIDSQFQPEATLLADGRVLVAFTTSDPTDGDNWSFGVSGRIGRPQPDGSMSFGEEFRINEGIASSQSDPQVTQLVDGRVLVTFRTFDPDPDLGFELLGRIGKLEADGSISFGSEFRLQEHRSGSQFDHEVTQLADGRVMVTFSTFNETDGDISSPGVSGRIFDLSGTGTNGDDTLIAVEDDVVVNGFGGNDTLIGNSGNDRLSGGDGNDDIHGAAGDDILWGGSGKDTMTGGNGRDTFIIADLSDVDIITDYTEGEDRIDLTALLAGVTLTDANKAEYVRVQGNTLQVDVDGGGDSFVDAATLNGVTAGVDVTILDNADTTAVEISIVSTA